MFSGASLAQRRQQCGLSQRGLARSVRTSQPAVAMWETGKRVPRSNTVALLATALQCEIGDLHMNEPVVVATPDDHHRLTDTQPTPTSPHARGGASVHTSLAMPGVANPG